jgi:hypothetical protein
MSHPPLTMSFFHTHSAAEGPQPKVPSRLCWI